VNRIADLRRCEARVLAGSRLVAQAHDAFCVVAVGAASEEGEGGVGKPSHAVERRDGNGRELRQAIAAGRGGRKHVVEQRQLALRKGGGGGRRHVNRR
jgi:hypothetical protein